MRRTKLQVTASVGIMVFLVAALVVLAQPPGARADARRAEGRPRRTGAADAARSVRPDADARDDGSGRQRRRRAVRRRDRGRIPGFEQTRQERRRKAGTRGTRPCRSEDEADPAVPQAAVPGPAAPVASADRAPRAGGPSPTFAAATQPKDDGERAILSALDDIQQKQGRRMNVPTADGRLLRTLAEALDAKTVVEFGTSNGVSAIWLSLALRKTGGKLITHETRSGDGSPGAKELRPGGRRRDRHRGRRRRAREGDRIERADRPGVHRRRQGRLLGLLPEDAAAGPPRRPDLRAQHEFPPWPAGISSRPSPRTPTSRRCSTWKAAE